LSTQTHQSISAKQINLPTPTTSLWSKTTLNNVYGAAAQASSSVSAITASRTLQSMQGISRVLRASGIDLDVNKKHAISNDYPYNYVSCNRDQDISFDDMVEFAMNHTTFDRRYDAEVARYQRLIDRCEKQKKIVRVPKKKFKRGKEIQRGFDGYKNTKALKIKEKLENNKFDTEIKSLTKQMENIGEEHPEWLI